MKHLSLRFENAAFVDARPRVEVRIIPPSGPHLTRIIPVTDTDHAAGYISAGTLPPLPPTWTWAIDPLDDQNIVRCTAVQNGSKA